MTEPTAAELDEINTLTTVYDDALQALLADDGTRAVTILSTFIEGDGNDAAAIFQRYYEMIGTGVFVTKVLLREAYGEFTDNEGGHFGFEFVDPETGEAHPHTEDTDEDRDIMAVFRMITAALNRDNDAVSDVIIAHMDSYGPRGAKGMIAELLSFCVSLVRRVNDDDGSTNNE